MIREYEARTSSQYCFIHTVTASSSKCSNLTPFCRIREFEIEIILLHLQSHCWDSSQDYEKE